MSQRLGQIEKANLAQTSCYDDEAYQRVIGDQWAELASDIQQRFASQLCRKTYVGKMRYVHLSKIGWVLAKLTRLIGRPLAQSTGRHIPTRVEVFYNAAKQGMMWERWYDFGGTNQECVCSTKCISLNDQLSEHLGGGFSMSLRTRVINGALYFESDEYYWTGLGRCWKLPRWLSPGRTLVFQKSLKNNRFQFYLSVVHPWFGRLITQSGVFKAQESAKL